MKIADATAALQGELRLLLEQSGDRGDGFDIAGWLQIWLKEPLPELAGATPAQVMRTASGQRQVLTLLERMRGGLPG